MTYKPVKDSRGNMVLEVYQANQCVMVFHSHKPFPAKQAQARLKKEAEHQLRKTN